MYLEILHKILCEVLEFVKGVQYCAQVQMWQRAVQELYIFYAAQHGS